MWRMSAEPSELALELLQEAHDRALTELRNGRNGQGLVPFVLSDEVPDYCIRRLVSDDALSLADSVIRELPTEARCYVIVGEGIADYGEGPAEGIIFKIAERGPDEGFVFL